MTDTLKFYDVTVCADLDITVQATSAIEAERKAREYFCDNIELLPIDIDAEESEPEDDED